MANVDAVPLNVADDSGNGVAAMVSWVLVSWHTSDESESGSSPLAEEIQSPLSDGIESPSPEDEDEIFSIDETDGGVLDGPRADLEPGESWVGIERVTTVNSTEPSFGIEDHGYMITAYDESGMEVSARRIVYPSITTMMTQTVYESRLARENEDGSTDDLHRTIRATPMNFRFEGLEPGSYSFSVEAVTCAGWGESSPLSKTIALALEESDDSMAYLDSDLGSTTEDTLLLQAIRDVGLQWQDLELVEPIVDVTVHALSSGRGACVRWSTPSVDLGIGGPAPEDDGTPGTDDLSYSFADGGYQYAVYVLELPKGHDSADGLTESGAKPTTVYMLESSSGAGRAAVSLMSPASPGDIDELSPMQDSDEGASSDLLVGVQVVDMQGGNRSRIVWGVRQSTRDLPLDECD